MKILINIAVAVLAGKILQMMNNAGKNTNDNLTDSTGSRKEIVKAPRTPWGTLSR